MTLQECRSRLAEIRARQNSAQPRVRVLFRGMSFQGLVVYSDSDRRDAAPARDRYGMLVLEELGLAPGPQLYMQIASIAPEGLSGIDD